MFCNVTLGQIKQTEERYVWFDLSAFVSVEEEEAREKEADRAGPQFFYVSSSPATKKIMIE